MTSHDSLRYHLLDAITVDKQYNANFNSRYTAYVLLTSDVLGLDRI